MASPPRTSLDHRRAPSQKAILKQGAKSGENGDAGQETSVEREFCLKSPAWFCESVRLMPERKAVELLLLNERRQKNISKSFKKLLEVF
jgi:hypothetical protein